MKKKFEVTGVNVEELGTEIKITVMCSVEEEDVLLEEEESTAEKLKQEIQREERRIEEDNLEDPPISSEILDRASELVERLTHSKRGSSIKCVVLGKYTGMFAAAMSDAFSGAGGKVLCIGDSVDESGSPSEAWKEYVGERFGKTVWPVKGDTDDLYQSMEKKIDVVLVSDCGVYTKMASTLTRWFGLVSDGGFICGTQYDKGHYPASVRAIEEVFGENGPSIDEGGFWKFSKK
tara:strand:+ start:567 stop:1268 length:702 start_codon:yes stop_codon:yes gene_type:complete